MLSGRGLCDELITPPEESYRLWYVVVCDLETSRMGAPYIYIYIYIYTHDISRLKVNPDKWSSTVYTCIHWTISVFSSDVLKIQLVPFLP